MKPPEHHFINEYDQREIRRMWLGSGLVDKNGVEIYEGDRVQIGDEPEIYTILFDDAAFWLGDNEFFLYHFDPSELEVVGHIAEEQQ